MSAAPLRARALAREALPFVLVTLIWGSTWLVIRGQLGIVPSAWSVCYRFALAAAAMFAVAAATRASLLPRLRDLDLLVLIGAAQFVVNFNLVYLAERHVTSGLVAVVFALLVVPNAVLGRVLLGERLSRPFLLGSGIALGGIALLFAHELDRGAGSRAGIALGIGVTLVAVLAASIANVTQATRRARALPVFTLIAWSMALGAAMNAGVAFAVSGPPRFDASPGYVLGLLYLSLAASALAFGLYYPLIRRIGAARAAYINAIVPVFAMTLSTLFEGYRWSPGALGGAALVLGGLVVAIRSRSPAR